MVTAPDPALTGQVSAASVAKYGMGSHSIEGSYFVLPSVVVAWSEEGFPTTATRWVFD